MKLHNATSAVIESKDGSFFRFIWKRNERGLYDTETHHYGSDGYARVQFNQDRKDVTFDAIDKSIEAARSLWPSVVLY
jgi:hypothetical protein